MMVAAFRAMGTAADPPLCDDPWAHALAGDDGFGVARRFEEAYGHAPLWIGLRTSWLDEQVKAMAGPSRPQVVILGAGLDTRAARLSSPGVRFFEVDHPATLADKRLRLATLRGYPAEAATHVTCDFEAEDFLEQLDKAGFDPDLATVFVWEGVTPYLTEGAVRTTLSRMAQCAPRSIVLFDYIMKTLAEGRPSMDAEDSAVRGLIDGLREPFVFGLNDPVPLLYDCGFRHVRTLTFDELCLSRTGNYDRARKFRFQGLIAASRAAPLSIGAPV